MLMARVTRKANNNRIARWLRWLHRDLGYFVVGMSLVYGVSGIILNHMGNSDPSYSIKKINDLFPVQLSQRELIAHWKTKAWNAELARILPVDNENLSLLLKGGQGNYNKTTGEVRFEVYKKLPLVDFINKLHYNRKVGWSFFADLFAGSLIFLAISGLFLVRGKNGFIQRGIWIMLAGMVVLVLYFFFSN